MDPLGRGDRMNAFNLLIIYTDGTSHVVSGVTSYKIESEKQHFIFEKNGYRNFFTRSRCEIFWARKRLFKLRRCDYECGNDSSFSHRIDRRRGRCDRDSVSLSQQVKI